MEQFAYIVTALCLLILKRTFETRLDAFYHSQDIIYNFRAWPGSTCSCKEPEVVASF